MIVVIAIVGALYLFIGRPDKNVQKHLHDALEPTGSGAPWLRSDRVA